MPSGTIRCSPKWRRDHFDSVLPVAVPGRGKTSGEYLIALRCASYKLRPAGKSKTNKLCESTKYL